MLQTMRAFKLLRCSTNNLRYLNLKKTFQNNGTKFYSSTGNNTNTSKSNFPKSKIGIVVGGVVTGTVAGYLLKQNFSNDETNIQTTNFEKSSLISQDTTQNCEIPEHIPYLIIGGGTAAFSALRTLRSKDPRARVLVISEEEYYPYMKPPLTKELWDSTLEELDDGLQFSQYTGKKRSLYFEHGEYYCKPIEAVMKENGGVAFLPKTRVVDLIPESKKAVLSNGHTISYGKALIATGGHPKNLPLFEEASSNIKSKVGHLKTIDDFKRLEKISREKKHITIIGGGFVGSELSFALANRYSDSPDKINLVVPEKGVLSYVLPNYLSDWVTNKINNTGIKMKSGVEVTKVEESGDRVKLTLSNKETIETDYVVVAVGIKPNLNFASKAKLEVDDINGGLLVNPEFSVSSNIWAAGDVASFYDPTLDNRRRVEHHDHSIVTGKLAAENMVGLEKKYKHQSMFWCDLGKELSFEGVGLTDPSLRTVGVFAKPTSTNATMEAGVDALKLEEPIVAKQPSNTDQYDKGVLFYLKDDLIVGVLTWNLFGRMKMARRLLEERKKFDDFPEVAKLFNLNDQEEEAE